MAAGGWYSEVFMKVEARLPCFRRLIERGDAILSQPLSILPFS